MQTSKPLNPDSAQLADQLSRVALGDRAAFRRVYELSSAHLFGVALRILNRRDLAEEVLQEGLAMIQESFDVQKKTTDNQIKLRRFDEYLDRGIFGLRLGTRIAG